jgi:hypothetical protein
MRPHVLFYGYLFLSQIRINVKKDLVGSKTFHALVKSCSVPFLKDCKLSPYEVSPKV